MDTKRIILLIAVSANFVFLGIVISLQPAFYPTEAELKGAKPSQYGFVFGIASLAGFGASPIFARYGSSMGPKLVYITGGLIQGSANTLFGLLEFINPTGWFIGISYFLRFVEGAADVASNAALLAIITALFPGNAASLTAMTESILGFGIMIGPLLGSLLYSVGGFGLPFYTVGIAVILLTLLLIIIVPTVDASEVAQKQNPTNSKSSLSLIDVAKSPLFFLALFDNFLAFVGNGMIESMLEPHMKNSEAAATQLQVAAAFTILGGTYMICSLVAGRIADKLKYPTIVTIVGHAFIITCFVFLGPAIYLPLDPAVPLIYVAIVCIGAGHGLILVSTFARLHKAIERLGYEKSIHANMIVSSLWVGSFHLGNFVGPTAAGFLVEAVGFRQTTLYFQIPFFFALFVNICALVYNVKRFGQPLRAHYQSIPDNENAKFHGKAPVPSLVST